MMTIENVDNADKEKNHDFKLNMICKYALLDL